MAKPSYRDIASNGLAQQPGAGQLLGLCPLLGVSNSAVNTGAGAGNLRGTLTCSTSPCRWPAVWSKLPMRLPVFVIVIAR